MERASICWLVFDYCTTTPNTRNRSHTMHEYTPPQLTIVGSVADLTLENDISLNDDNQLGAGVLGGDREGDGPQS